MLKVSQIEHIKELWSNGSSIAAIKEIMEIDRKTIMKYIEMEDFSKGVEFYAQEVRLSKLDPYKPLIDQLLEKERGYSKKQRFTAKRMHEYLVKEHGAKELAHSYILVRRYMKDWKNRRIRTNSEPGTLKLLWHPGEAQVDFGQADFIEPDGRYSRQHYLTISFPHSNKGIYEILPGENGECVCQGLLDFFLFIGGVPKIIVFDNATGIAKRWANIIQQSELFTRFRLHYKFVARFTNVASGWEKGNVENKVGTLRRNLLVPPLQLSYPLEDFNKNVMIPQSFGFRSSEDHYEKAGTIDELYQLDEQALLPLPSTPFHVARIDTMKCDGTGRFRLDEKHHYILGPLHAGETILVSRGAWEISVYTYGGEFIKTFPRAYGGEHTITYDIEALLAATVYKPNAWLNSPVRDAMGEGPFKKYLDTIEGAERRRTLYMLNECTGRFGFGAASVAANALAAKGKIPTKEDLFTYCNRLETFPLGMSENATNVNLDVYDKLLSISRESIV